MIHVIIIPIWGDPSMMIKWVSFGWGHMRDRSSESEIIHNQTVYDGTKVLPNLNCRTLSKTTTASTPAHRLNSRQSPEGERL